MTLKPGDEQKCPRCGAWHVLEAKNADSGIPYVRAMLYVTCAGRMYFAGTIGTESRTDTRPRAN